jgi:hypothetical protein
MVREGFGWQLRWKCSSQARTISVKLCHKETRGLCAQPHLGHPSRLASVSNINTINAITIIAMPGSG